MVAAGVRCVRKGAVHCPAMKASASSDPFPGRIAPFGAAHVASRTWGVLSATAADAPAVARLSDLLADHLDGVVNVPGRTSWRTTPAPGVLGRLLSALSAVPRDVERIAYLDAGVLDALGIEPVLEMISWLDDEHAAVVRAAPVTDALKAVDGRTITGSVDRAGLFAPQPPHIIRRDALDAALHASGRRIVSDDPAGLLVAAGHAVRLVRDAGPPITLLPAR
jgi:hypothetical protein